MDHAEPRFRRKCCLMYPRQVLRKIDAAHGLRRAVGRLNNPDKIVRIFAHFYSHPIAWKLHDIVCRDWIDKRAGRLGRAVKIVSVQ